MVNEASFTREFDSTAIKAICGILKVVPHFINLIQMGRHQVDRKCSICSKEEKKYTRISIDPSNNTSSLSKKFYDSILLLFGGKFPHPSEIILCGTHMSHVDLLAKTYSKVTI